MTDHADEAQSRRGMGSAVEALTISAGANAETTAAEKVPSHTGPGESGVVSEPSVPPPPKPVVQRSLDGEPMVGDPGSTVGMDVLLISDPIGRPDVALDGGRIGALQVRAASVRGKRHREHSINASTTTEASITREDEFSFGSSADGAWLVVVVADGVSGSSRGHVAATIAARKGVEAVLTQLDSGVAPDEIGWNSTVVPELSTLIIKEALRLSGQGRLKPDEEISGDRLRELAGVTACAAVAAIVATLPDDTGGHAYWCVSLAGDCSVWVRYGVDLWCECISGKDQSGDVQSSELIPLPMVASQPQAHPLFASVRPGEALVLMSDGVGDPLGDGTTPVARYLSGQWVEPPGLHTFGAQVDFHARGYSDDRTAVAIWPQRQQQDGRADAHGPG